MSNGELADMPPGSPWRRSAWSYSQLWYRTLKISYLRFYASGTHYMAAAIGFYCLICLAPIGILFASLLHRVARSAIISPEAYERLRVLVSQQSGTAADQIMWLIERLAGGEAWIGIGGSLIARLVSILALVWGGLHLFDIIQISLAVIWTGRPLRPYLARKLISLLMMGAAGLLFVSLVVLLSLRHAVLSRLAPFDLSYWMSPLPHALLTFAAGAIISTIGYLLLYKFMPGRKVMTLAALVGAVFAAIVWQSLSPIFTRLLVFSAQFGSAFGLGWVVVFGLWAFMGAQVMLYGGHIAAAYEHVFVRRRPRGEDDALIDSGRRSLSAFSGDRDAEAAAVIADLKLDREPAACELDPAGHKIINGIILAGGRVPQSFAERVGTDIKGLIQIDGHAAIEYVVAAMRQVPGMQKLVLVGDKAAFIHHSVADQLDGIIDEGPDIWHNLMRAIRFLGDDRRILLGTSDIPLLTSEALCAFLGKCDPDADLCYPVTRRQPTSRMFGRRYWAFLPLREGWITHTCNILFDPRLVLKNQDFVERFLSRRKDLWGAAGTLGGGFLVRFFLGWYVPFLRYHISDIAQHIQALTGARKCQGIVLEYPEIALDIDRASDVEEIEDFIRRERERGTWCPSLPDTCERSADSEVP